MKTFADIIRAKQRRFMRLLIVYAKWHYKMKVLPPGLRGFTPAVDSDDGTPFWIVRCWGLRDNCYGGYKHHTRRHHAPGGDGEDNPGFEDAIRAIEDG